MARGPETRSRILEVTQRQVTSRGLSRFTLQGVADELGLTKQAVLYWFPSRNALLSELLYQGVERESEVLVGAVERADTAAEAVAAFLREGFAHHRRAMPTFRLMYLAGQFERSARDLLDPEEARVRLYPVTSRYYDALEAKLRADPGFPDGVNPRDFAVSVHMTLIGHACSRGLMDATDSEFKQSFDAMLDALIAVLTRGLTGA